MASNLRVDQITASTTGSVSIGTATFTGGLSGSITGLNVTGVITATTLNQNVSGILTAQNGIRVTGDRVGINPVNATEPTAPLEIRSASTVQTNTGHIVLSGDSATVGEGPQIMFNESGSGSSYAGAYIGHIRQGSNSIGDLVFGTRGSTGDASTIPTERLRITSSGRISINNTSGPTDIPGTAHDTVVVGNSAATGGGITLEVASGNNCAFQMYAQGSQPAGRFLYDGSDNTVKIWSQNSGGTSESVRMTFKEDGNVEINNGNLVLASGHGIDFSATGDSSGTASSEILDDYERGFFTPKISFGGSDAGVTYTANNGAYTKVGRLVTCYGIITLTSNGTSTGNAAIFNLPFASNADALSGTSTEGGGHNIFQNNLAGTIYGPMSLGVIQNNTFAYYYGATTTGGTMSNMTKSNLSNTYDCRFILWYYT